jgi:hypothetical protein
MYFFICHISVVWIITSLPSQIYNNSVKHQGKKNDFLKDGAGGRSRGSQSYIFIW